MPVQYANQPVEGERAGHVQRQRAGRLPVMEHLTGAARELIPWFSRFANGYLFMLTKSDNVEGILDLEHNGRTIVPWSMNAPSVSHKFELGAPSFERRLAAARLNLSLRKPRFARISVPPLACGRSSKRLNYYNRLEDGI